MFRIYYGQCIRCPIGIIRPIIVRAQLCKQHNEEKKKIGKSTKIKEPKEAKKKGPKYGQCRLCPENTNVLLQVKHYCRFHNEQKKKEEKSKRVARLINKSKKKKSTTKLKEELDAVFSLYIRHVGSKDGMNQCFTCEKTFLIKELQDGHYESRKFLALRYEISNNHPQCYMCNIIKKGNYTVYALKMIEKYGKEHLDMLAIKKHNVIHWTAFEYQFMIDEYTKKLNELKKTL